MGRIIASEGGKIVMILSVMGGVASLKIVGFAVQIVVRSVRGLTCGNTLRAAPTLLDNGP